MNILNLWEVLPKDFQLDIEECLREQNVDEKVLEEWNYSISERFPMRSLGTKNQQPMQKMRLKR